MLRKNSLKFLACLMMLVGSSGFEGSEKVAQYKDTRRYVGYTIGLLVAKSLRELGVNPKNKYLNILLEKSLPGAIGAILGNKSFRVLGLECKGVPKTHWNASGNSSKRVVDACLASLFRMPKAFWTGHKQGQEWSSLRCANGNLSFKEIMAFYGIRSGASIFEAYKGSDFKTKEDPFCALTGLVTWIDDEDLAYNPSCDRFIELIAAKMICGTLVGAFLNSLLRDRCSQGNNELIKDLLKGVFVPLLVPVLLDCKPFVNYVKKFCLKPSEIEAERCREQFAPGQMPVVPDCSPDKKDVGQQFPEEPVVGKTSRRPSNGGSLKPTGA